MKVETPQEAEVWYVLPAVRRQLMLSMIAQGQKQKDVARLLNVTDAAVSQYVHNKRATNVDFPAEILRQIDASAKALIEDTSTLHKEMQRILHAVWETKFMCSVCRGCTSADDSCQVCYD